MVASPITGLVRGLNALIAGLAIQLQQIVDEGLLPAGEAAGEAPAEAEQEAQADQAAEEAAQPPRAPRRRPRAKNLLRRPKSPPVTQLTRRPRATDE